MALIVSNQPET